MIRCARMTCCSKFIVLLLSQYDHIKISQKTTKYTDVTLDTNYWLTASLHAANLTTSLCSPLIAFSTSTGWENGFVLWTTQYCCIRLTTRRNSVVQNYVSSDFQCCLILLHLLFLLSNWCIMLFTLCEAGLNPHDHTAVVEWCKTNDISLVVIGPENLLAEGLSDSLIDAGNCFSYLQATWVVVMFYKELVLQSVCSPHMHTQSLYKNNC